MLEQLIVRLDPEIKGKLNKLAQSEGKSTSQVIREFIEEYIRDRDMSGYVDGLWKRIGNKISTKGKPKKDIASAIRQSRNSLK